MNITDYILKEIKALTLKTNVANALEVCQNFPISHIPIVEEGQLLGCLAESDIRSIENSDEILQNYQDLFEHFFATPKTGILELISLFADNDTNIIPILNLELQYMGYYDLADILDVFANSPFLQRDNDTLIIAKQKIDFSMSQVAQIVESNNAKLIGSYISNQNIDDVEITLKIKAEDLNEIIQTFRRYDYTIVSESEDDSYLEELKERADYFKKYLEM